MRELKRSLAIMEKAEGPEHPHVAPVLTTLAEVELRLKRPAEADQLLTRALAIREKAGGPPHPDQIATLTVLAETRLAQEKTDEAEDLQKRALALCESLLGPDHPAVADARVRLAQIYGHRHCFDDAEGQLKRALTSEERNWGPEHRRVVQLLGIYAHILRRAGRGAEAEPLEARIAAVRTKPADRREPLAPNLLPFPDDPRPDPPPFGRVGLADLNRLWAEWGAKRVAPWLRLGPVLAPASPAWTAAALASGTARRLAGVPDFDQEPVVDKAPVDRRRMKHFRLPYRINENDRPRVGSIKLFVSCDQGENWHLVKEVTPAEPAIQFSTAADGLHWFAVQVTDKDGRKNPNDLTDLEPAIAVVIEGNEVLTPR